MAGYADLSMPRAFDLDPADANLTGFASNVTGASWSLTATTSGDGLAHQVSIRNDSGNDKAAINITLVGTDQNGAYQTETIAGPGAGATVESTGYYLTLTSVTPASTWGADTADVGWVDEFASPTINLNWGAEDVAALRVVVTGTINFTLQQTFDPLDGQLALIWETVPGAGSQTATSVWNTTGGATGVRLLVNSYSSGAELRFNVNQTFGANAPGAGSSGPTSDVNVAEWGGAATTLGQKAMADSLPVVLASDQSALTVAGGVTPADNFANPTTAIASFALAGVWDGAAWDRMPGNSAGGIYAQGAVADDAAAAGNPVPVGGIYNSTKPTYTNLDRSQLQQDSRGNLLVAIQWVDSVTPGGTAPADNKAAVQGLGTWSQNAVYNGTNWDRLYTAMAAANTGVGVAATGYAKLSGTQLTKVTVNISTATTTALIAGTASQNVRVYKVVLNFGAAQTLDIIGSGGTSLVGGAMSFGANGGLVLDFDGEPWWTTPTAEGLSLITTTTGVVRGTVYYIKAA